MKVVVVSYDASGTAHAIYMCDEVFPSDEEDKVINLYLGGVRIAEIENFYDYTEYYDFNDVELRVVMQAIQNCENIIEATCEDDDE